MRARFVLPLLLGVFVCSREAAGAALVSNADLTGSRTTPSSSGIAAVGRWSDSSGGFRVAWKIAFDGVYWNYEYSINRNDGSRSNCSDLSHWILEVSRVIPCDNVGSYIFNANFPIVGPRVWTADPTSPTTTNPGANKGNPNLPKDIYGIKLDSGQSTYRFKSTQAPMWGDFYAKSGTGQSGAPATAAWNAGIGTDPADSATNLTPWIPVPDTVTAGVCGNGKVDAGEACDGGGNTATCDSDCTKPKCGDGLKNPAAGEQCEPPNTDTCDCDCKTTTHRCGDGTPDAGEQCDDGAANSDTKPDACREDCKNPYCGDDVIDSGETCDPPKTGTCDSECQTIVPKCGDGHPDTGEQCDDGTDNSNTEPDACRENCKNPYCGDNVIDSGEQCDPPNGTTCDAECDNVGPWCGDGTKNGTEECDEGGQTSTCDADCTLPDCGDGVKNPAAGEECEPPNTDTCDDECKTIVPRCGDGTKNGSEECDEGGQTETCEADCTRPECGDGVKNPGAGEECEPPNTQTCDSNCRTVPFCGDGHIDQGEQCDPPNGTTCDAQCKNFCGNGQTDTGEECDPPSKEICDDMKDNDGDDFIDCDDLDCPKGVPTCNDICEVVEPCRGVHRDPATIVLSDDGPDMFQFHARVSLPLGRFDPTTRGFGIALWNANGLVWSGRLEPGDIRPRNGMRRFFVFRDENAVLGTGVHDGIAMFRTHFRNFNGMASYQMRFRAYGDFSAATEARMTLQVYDVDSVASATADWKRTKKGWYLRNKFLVGSN